MSLQRITAVGFLFDLDGVLADSTEEVEDHWRQFARWYELDEDELVANTHGVRDSETIRRVLSDRSEEDIKTAIDRFRELEVTDTLRTTEVPGASSLLKALPVSQTCLVTSCTFPLAKARLGQVDIELPKLRVMADDVDNGKPHPEPYLKGAETLAVDPKDCVVFEDSESGVQSAIAAGATPIGLATNQSADQLRDQVGPCGLVVQDLSCITVEFHEGQTVLVVDAID